MGGGGGGRGNTLLQTESCKLSGHSLIPRLRSISSQDIFLTTFCIVTITSVLYFRVPQGLEDVSKYPKLVAELLRRNYTDEEAGKVVGNNLITAMEKMEKVIDLAFLFPPLQVPLHVNVLANGI